MEELVKDIIQWDVKSWSRALHYWEERIDWNTIQTGLELGGNRGGLSLWLAKKKIATICSDFQDVEESAKPLHEKHDVKGFIQYQDIDATSISYENCFDLIVFKSIIGGIGREGQIERQKQVFKEIHKALKPGGKLLFAENLIASPVHQWIRKKFVNWGDSWRYVNTSEMEEFLVDFSFFDIRSTGVLGTLGRNETQRSLLATADEWIFNRICPEDWKYLCFGIAVK